MTYLLPTILATSMLLFGCSGTSSPPAPAQKTVAKSVAAVQDATGKPVAAPSVVVAPETAAKNQAAQYYDENADGVVSHNEMVSSTVNKLLKHSAGVGNSLTKKEFHSAMGDTTGADFDIAKVATEIDKDQDGVLSEKELADHVALSVADLAPAKPTKPAK
jgi:PBP1b-binding outer membrane lipoprotein LpoB